jgi:diguanylate cyclase (GGDEF)-like protein/PAS domain S-box-containing protein
MQEQIRRRNALLWSVVALVAGLLVSAAVAHYAYRVLESERDVQFERLAERSFDAMENQLEVCGLLVRSVQSLFLASDAVEAREFERVYANLRPREVFPSLQAMAFARRHQDAGERYVTELVAPMAGNERLVGLDLRAQPDNLEALKRAEATDQPAMTAAFLLVQLADAPGNRDGIVIRLPVYTGGLPPRTQAERNARLVGSLAVSFRVSTLIESALPRETRETMDVHVRDLSDPAQPLLYDALTPAQGELRRATLLRSRDIDYGGRTWRMELRPRPGMAQVPLAQPAVVFLGGVLASVLLAGLVWSLMRTRSRALDMAEQWSAQYRDSEARFRSVNELLPALVLLARPDGSIVFANRAARAHFGWGGEPPAEPLPAVLGDVGAQALAALEALRDGEPRVHSVQLAGTGAAPFWATLSLARIDLDDQPHLLAVATDITELRDLAEQLRHQASHDLLTGLANRQAFEQRLDDVLADPDAPGDSSLLYVDLDQFKLINDTSGHYAGDQLLVHLARQLRTTLEPGELLARLGGDEFGVLLDDGGEARARRVAERLRQQIDRFVFVWENRSYGVTGSIGVALVREGMSKRELLAMADTACYLAKERGRNRIHLFVDTDDDASIRRTEMEWVNRVRWAMAEGRLSLDYQELSALGGGAVEEGAHFELLLRLHDEDGRPVPPGAFIPAAERYGLMPQLDRWVVATALANFDQLHPSGHVGLCAINLSGPTVDDEEFADFVLDKLREHAVPPHKVCFEITETAAVGNMARVMRFITRLRDVGCRFALDDFGAGMSSFGYLKNLPVDMIKIDGSFIRELENDPMSFSIVRAVTQIGHQIGLKVIAEWVGSDATCELLRLLGVNYAQGYYLHEPEPTPYSKAR